MSFLGRGNSKYTGLECRWHVAIWGKQATCPSLFQQGTGQPLRKETPHHPKQGRYGGTRETKLAERKEKSNGWDGLKDVSKVDHQWKHCSLSGLLETHVFTSVSWSKVAKNSIDLGRRHKWKLCSYMCTLSLLIFVGDLHSKGKEMTFMSKCSLTLWSGLRECSARCSVVMDLTCCLLHNGPRAGLVLSKSNTMSCAMKCVFLHLCVFCSVHGDHSWCIKGPLPHLQNTHLKASVIKQK